MKKIFAHGGAAPAASGGIQTYQESREISEQFEYDRLYDELLELEKKKPVLCWPEARPRRWATRC